jgi:hypothetical protein
MLKFNKFLAGGTMTGPLNAPSINGELNAAAYCATPYTLDQTCIQNAAAAATSGQQIFVPAGTYNGTGTTISQSNMHLVLDPGASINYPLGIQGLGFYRSNTVALTSSPTPGTTTFLGNFSAYSPGQFVLIEQPAGGSTSALEFQTVSSASSTQLVITAGLRFTYTTPNISQVGTTAVKYTGSTAAAAQMIPIACTSHFSVGEVIRIENTTGTDSPNGSAYFEIGRVQGCSASMLTLETALHSAFVNPWIVEMNVISNVSVQGQGGYIQQLSIENARDVSIDGLVTNVTIAQQLYDFKFSNLRGATTGPSAFYYTYLWNGSVSNLLAYGSNATTDNGNVKFLGVQNVAITGISTWGGQDSSQGSYPFMIDMNFTPYNIWNAGDAVSGVSVGSTSGIGNYTVYFGGMHHSSASGITATGTVELLLSNGFTLSSLATQGQVLIRSGTNYHLNNFTADSMLIGSDSAVTASTFDDFAIWGGTTETGGGAISVYSGSSNLRFLHGEFPLSNNTFYTINAQSTNLNLYFEDIQDYTGGTNFIYSIYTGGPATTETLVADRFAGPIQGTVIGSYSTKLLANCGTMTTSALPSDNLACSWVTTSSACTITPSNSTAVAWTYFVPNAGSVTVFHASIAGGHYAIACSAN